MQVPIDPAEEKIAEVRVRPLYWNGVLKEFTTGEPHDITDRLFVVRRAYRLNDNLPSDQDGPRQWVWRLGDWLLVNRATGKVTALVMPDFHPIYSDVSWYRDYAAYCGVSEGNSTLFAVVIQAGSRKAVLRKELGATTLSALRDSECAPAVWERRPAKVTFHPKRFPQLTYTVFGHSAGLTSDQSDE